MQFDPKRAPEMTEDERGLLTLTLLALIVGGVAGLVGAAFRSSLEWAERFREALVAVAHRDHAYGFLFFVVGCAGAASVAAWLVRRYSLHASGSGIPHVEAVLHGLVPPAPFSLLPFRRNWPDCRALLAAGAGAGLATAFNAPIAGAVFVLEELVQRFEHRIAIVALAASASAIYVARMLLGDAPDFTLAPLDAVGPATQPLFLVLGGVAGLLAIAYNKALLATIAGADRLKAPPELRAASIGAGVGALAWFAPAMVGGGDGITRHMLSGAGIASLVPLAFLLRFALGAVSYAAGTPGGLFAPLLALGAQFGFLFGAGCRLLFPSLEIQPEAFALVGMTALFTGVVRAPLTGIVLVTEMTANTALLLPMLGACFSAMLAPTLLRNAPIYESLRAHTLRREAAQQEIARRASVVR